jgi:hypothetical protein
VNVWTSGRCCLQISLIYTALCGGNLQTAYASEASFPMESFQADAIAPTVPKFSSVTFPEFYIFKVILYS